MITIQYHEEEMEGINQNYPEVQLTVRIDNEGMAWDRLMKIYAQQLPKMGYVLDVGMLESAIDDAMDGNRASVFDEGGDWHRGDY